MKFLIALVVLLPSLLPAQWTPEPETAVTLVDLIGTQNNGTSVPDGLDGVITVWEDGRSGNADIYVQRVDADGVPQWTPNGVPVCVFATTQTWSDMVTDGSNGAVIAWFDDRSGTDSVFAQRVDSSGNVLWATDGVEVFASTTGSSFLRMVSDGAGGAYIAWIKGADISVQHVDGTGAVSWPNPAVLCDAPNAKAEVIGLPDGSGGATFAWVDGRWIGNPKVYAQNVQPSGAMSWTDDGVVVATDGTDQRNVSMITDGAGGYLLAWQDYRDWSSLGINIYAQRLLASGAIAWGTGGKPICVAPNTQGGPSIASSGDGGMVLAWEDWRHTGAHQTYAQRIDAAGDPVWPVDGVRVAPTDYNEDHVLVAYDGAGGAHVFWESQFAIHTRSIDAAGVPIGAEAGAVFIDLPPGDYLETVVKTSDGGAILTSTKSNDGLYCDKLGGVATPQFIRGDCNDDGSVNIADAQYLLGHLFVAMSPSPPCMAAADVNAGDTVDVSDAVFTLNYLFVLGSPAPPAPFPSCGSDATTPLPCASYSSCP